VVIRPLMTSMTVAAFTASCKADPNSTTAKHRHPSRRKQCLSGDEPNSEFITVAPIEGLACTSAHLGRDDFPLTTTRELQQRRISRLCRTTGRESPDTLRSWFDYSPRRRWALAVALLEDE